MASIEKYRTCVQELLEEYRSPKLLGEGVETQLLADTKRDHYQLVNVGWKKRRRVYFCTVHLDIKDGKIWLQNNQTDLSVVDDLVERGIPKEHIVGFAVS